MPETFPVPALPLEPRAVRPVRWFRFWFDEDCHENQTTWRGIDRAGLDSSISVVTDVHCNRIRPGDVSVQHDYEIGARRRALLIYADSGHAYHRSKKFGRLRQS